MKTQTQTNDKITKTAKYFDWWNGFLFVLLVLYFLGGSQIDSIKPFTSYLSNFIISGFLVAGLMAYIAILFPPKGTKRLGDIGYNVLNPKYRYVFDVVFLFVILINVLVDVIGLDNLTLLGVKFSQINTVDYNDTIAGILSVLISASIYCYAVRLQK